MNNKKVLNSTPEEYYDLYEGCTVFSKNVFSENIIITKYPFSLVEDSQLIIKIINKYKLYIYDNIGLMDMEELSSASRKDWAEYKKLLNEENLPTEGDRNDYQIFSKEGMDKAKKQVEEFKSKYQVQMKHIQENRDHWQELMEPIIKIYRIPNKIRLVLYKRFKKTTLYKLETAIKILKSIIPIFYQTQTFFEIKRKIQFYENELIKLNKRAGADQFAYFYLKNLFVELEKMNIRKKSLEEIVYMLKNRNFDFKKNEFIDFDKAELNNIKSLRHRVLS